MKYKKKLIEVALPLEAINEACIREKSIRHGHPSTLHLYWARRPLAAARAVIFASLIDDPSNDKSLSDEEVSSKRNKIFSLLIELVKWENVDNTELLKKANKLIKNSSTQGKVPPLLDPFCGGGTMPIEGQRLGLKSYGSDLNPLAVLITKGVTEIPYNLNNEPPINPDSKASLFYCKESSFELNGLIDDISYYGKVIADKVNKKLKYLFPLGPNNETIIGWIWARTVICPNPTCNGESPLVKSFILSRKKGNERSIDPIINMASKKITYEIKNTIAKVHNGTINRSNGKCIFCENSISSSYIKEQGKSNKIGNSLLAIITEGKQKRNYYSADNNQSIRTDSNIDIWQPDYLLSYNPRDLRVANFGLDTFTKLFTQRQLFTISTFADTIKELHKELLERNERRESYINGIITYLTFGLDKFIDYNSSLASWHNGRETIRNTFARQAISMTWDFTEINPFSNSTGNFISCVRWVEKVLSKLSPESKAEVEQLDASRNLFDISGPLISTDPPYFDNICYADLSDYFYVWMRHILKDIYPNVFSSILTPKKNEIVANKNLFDGSKSAAEEHFLNSLEASFHLIAKKANQNYPVTIFYAYKQTEVDSSGGVISTGWETFLEGLIRAGFKITATWPMRTEMQNRTIASKSNALASSIVVALRKKGDSAEIATRHEFLTALSNELEIAIIKMIESDISPVDLQQSAIGPGMAIYTKYAKVLEADGSSMTVRTALQLINAELDRIQENSDIEMDSETRFCVQWFDTYGFQEGPYGEAETLSKAKDISVQGLVNSGVFNAGSGKAKLKHWSEMKLGWDPREDDKLILWECTHYMIRELVDGDGELGAAKLAKFMGPQKADEAKELAYQLYHICDKRNWANYAGDYNTLVSNWTDIKSQIPNISEGQKTLF